MRIDMTSPMQGELNKPVTVVTDSFIIDVYPDGNVLRYVRRQDGILTGEAYEYHRDNSVARVG